MAKGNPHPKPGPGRPKGSPNRKTQMLRDMILGALDEKGGVAYLVKQADENPAQFMSLLGRVLPTQITGIDDGAIQITVTNKIIGKTNAD